jgi:tetratricopeptide (TPR) repeat protein
MHTRSYDDAIAALDKAASIDPSSQNKLALDTAYAEKKKSLQFKSNAPHIIFKEVKLSRVFSGAYKQYADKPVGTVVIQNSSATDYADLKLTFSIKGYMDYPTTVNIPKLKANSQQTIKLNASFNNKILDIDEDTGVQAEIALNYIRDGQSDDITITQPMTIYSRNAIVWGHPNMVGSFVTPKDNTLSDFVREVINENKPKARIINNSLRTAMTLFDVFGTYGIRYEADPNTPYSKVTDTSVDYVQFPRKTLKVKSGDCDDLSVLMSASLENLGIETAILAVPGHLLMMFNTGLPVSQRSQISLDDDLLALRNGQVWIPVEATMIGQPFAEAWAEGARKYYKYEASHQLEITMLAQAWQKYRPVTLAPANYTLTVPPRAEVAPMVTREKNILLEKTLDRMVSPYQTMADLDPSNIKARMQVAIIYARYGLYEKAEHVLDEIQAADPNSSAVHNNRGNIYFDRGDYERALESYRYAEKLDSNDAGIKMNLSMAYYKQGDLQKASEKYGEAKVIDAALAKKYSGYGKLLSK